MRKLQQPLLFRLALTKTCGLKVYQMAEITDKSPFGNAIRRTILRYDIKHVLEIGAFDGDGSTLVIAQALSLKSGSVSLASLESNPNRFDNLCKNAKPYAFVHPFCVSSIGRNAFTAWDFEADVWNSPFNGIKHAKEAVRQWHTHDADMIRGVESGFLEQETRGWDAALIDGGEFSGYDEFRLLKERTRCFFLDDSYSAFKTNRVRHELGDDVNWRMIWADQQSRNGAAIFVHKSLDKTPPLESLMIEWRCALRRFTQRV